MNDLKLIIKNYFPQFFTKKNREIWKNWVNRVYDVKDAYEIIGNPFTNDNFKLRAYLCFLLPFENKAVYKPNNNFRWEKFPVIDYENAGPTLHTCFTECICYLASQKKIYRWQVVELMGVCNNKDQEKIFRQFHPYDNKGLMEGETDTIFGDLLENEKILLKFKEQATSVLQKILMDNLEEKYLPQFETFTEGVVRVLKNRQKLIQINRPFPYSINLLMSQLKTISDVEKIRKRRDDGYFSDYYFQTAIYFLLTIKEEGVPEFCLQFLKDMFWVYGITTNSKPRKDLLDLARYVCKTCKSGQKTSVILWLEKLIIYNTPTKKQKRYQRLLKTKEGQRSKKLEAGKVKAREAMLA